MRVAIIGAGPAGLYLGAGLARRGHTVLAVDRDPGPAPDGSWPRRGVMQFHHAHGFRYPVVEALEAELPEVIERWTAAGAELVSQRLPNGREVLLGMRSRRETFERALRATAETEPGLELRVGHVDGVATHRGRAVGIRVDGTPVPADLVIDAAGRAGRATRALRPQLVTGGPCGTAYVDRQYRLRPGAEPGPLHSPVVWQAEFDGYLTLVFLHEQGIFSVLIVRPAHDQVLAELRQEAAFTAACAAIPGLADWVDPGRARPITPVLAGGALHNAYRGQTGPHGRLALPGLLFVGDAVATTTPNFGRGVTTTLWQAQQLLRLVDEHGADTVALGESFDEWCTSRIKPWVDDHVQMDDATRRRWAGEDVFRDESLPSNLIMAAAAADPSIAPAAGAYASMAALPATLRAVEPAARAVYATGWRPPVAPGPIRAELAEIIQRTLGTVELVA